MWRQQQRWCGLWAGGVRLQAGGAGGWAAGAPSSAAACCHPLLLLSALAPCVPPSNCSLQPVRYVQPLQRPAGTASVPLLWAGGHCACAHMLRLLVGSGSMCVLACNLPQGPSVQLLQRPDTAPHATHAPCEASAGIAVHILDQGAREWHLGSRHPWWHGMLLLWPAAAAGLGLSRAALRRRHLLQRARVCAWVKRPVVAKDYQVGRARYWPRPDGNSNVGSGVW
jgi:hypothetical protein